MARSYGYTYDRHGHACFRCPAAITHFWPQVHRERYILDRGISSPSHERRSRTPFCHTVSPRQLGASSRTSNLRPRGFPPSELGAQSCDPHLSARMTDLLGRSSFLCLNFTKNRHPQGHWGGDAQMCELVECESMSSWHLLKFEHMGSIPRHEDGDLKSVVTRRNELSTLRLPNGSRMFN